MKDGLRLKVSEIVNELFSCFPKELAEPWDKPGLSVGDPTAEVKAIACALDPTPESIHAAAELGCNVLVTHHPAFLEAPFPMTPQVATSSIGGANAYEAARLGVSLVAMHTNLDRSQAALELCSSKLGLELTGRLEEPDGYGAMLHAEGLALGKIAERCSDAFGCTLTVWGDEARPVGSCAFISGSGGSFADEAIAAGVDCVITGEAGYHRLLELSCAGVAAILLGHDASELAYAGLLAQTLARIAPDTRITVLDEGLRWHAWDTEE